MKRASANSIYSIWICTVQEQFLCKIAARKVKRHTSVLVDDVRHESPVEHEPDNGSKILDISIQLMAYLRLATGISPRGQNMQ